MARPGRAVGALGCASALLLTGCGSTLAAMPAATPAPYPGPLVVAPAPGVDRAHDPGAAGRVVDCDAAVVGGSSTDPFTGGEVGSSPRDALRESHDEGGWDGLAEGMRVVRSEPDRVLFAYAAGGRTKQAVVVRHGPAAPGTGAGADGLAWWVESWARCDIAEYPVGVAEERGWQVWTDSRGRRVSTAVVASRAGGDCLPGVTFLELDRLREDESPPRTYAARADAYPDHVAEPFREDVALPGDAVDTGYEHEGRHLWLSADGERAYVGTVDHVELWPRVVEGLGCA